MKKTILLFAAASAMFACVSIQSCKKEGPQGPAGTDGLNGVPGSVASNPDNAPHTTVDRFSAANAPMGKMFIRTSANGLPGNNAPINFDMKPFYTNCLGPNGEKVLYYNFDVTLTATIPVYVFVDASGNSVQGQWNVINAKPGDVGYNDFWRVTKVTVPAGYVPNTLRSANSITASGYTIQSMPDIVNCPVAPEGSTATKRYNGEDASLHKGWYKDSIIHYFTFTEKAMVGGSTISTSPVYSTFNINPGLPNGGPMSGVMEDASGQSHNVMATTPTDAAYSPVWKASIYDNANFSSVTNLTSALTATILMPNAMDVNCPVAVVQ